jgi:hypothetical protein
MAIDENSLSLQKAASRLSGGGAGSIYLAETRGDGAALGALDRPSEDETEDQLDDKLPKETASEADLEANKKFELTDQTLVSGI